MNGNEKAQALTRVFVYGTLKQGYHNHGWACRAARPVVTPARAFGVTLWDAGYGFPLLTAGGTRDEYGREAPVLGEVLEYPAAAIDAALEAMDRLEGVQPERRGSYAGYERAILDVEVGEPVDGVRTKVLAWVYLWRGMMAHDRRRITEWPKPAARAAGIHYGTD